MSSERLISANEAAEMFGVKRWTWYRWGKIDPDRPDPVIQKHMLTRWRLSDVEAYMKKMIDRNKK